MTNSRKKNYPLWVFQQPFFLFRVVILVTAIFPVVVSHIVPFAFFLFAAFAAFQLFFFSPVPSTFWLLDFAYFILPIFVSTKPFFAPNLSFFDFASKDILCFSSTPTIILFSAFPSLIAFVYPPLPSAVWETHASLVSVFVYIIDYLLNQLFIHSFVLKS